MAFRSRRPPRAATPASSLVLPAPPRLVGALLVGALLAQGTPVAAQGAARRPSRPRAATTAAPAPALVRYETGPTGNAARYRVRERLVGKTLDNDAVGETTALAGIIMVDARGQLLADSSRFVATVSGLTSDEPRRDRYVRNRILVTDSFPTTTFQATAVRGLAVPLPTSGPATFELQGTLTVKGVARPATWQVSATVQGDQLTGRATTRFTFADYRLLQPKVSVLLGVADTIALEYDFTMTRRR
jgi:polyisoprenoid-binding protein YceI